MHSTGRKILIVDSEPNLLITLEFLLAQHGFRVSVARTGEEALDAMAASSPDLVLMEVQLPFRTGFEVCQLIRRNPEWLAVRIILVTSREREVDVAKGMALGADAYVIKPFSNKDLVSKIFDLLTPPQ